MILHADGPAIIADTGYDADRILACARKFKMKPVIHPHPCRKKKRRIDRQLYGVRYRVECFFHDLKKFRAAAHSLRQDSHLLSGCPRCRWNTFCGSNNQGQPLGDARDPGLSNPGPYRAAQY
jgi:IS5 family transposase